jgi:hypothetical protein
MSEHLPSNTADGSAARDTDASSTPPSPQSESNRCENCGQEQPRAESTQGGADPHFHARLPPVPYECG